MDRPVTDTSSLLEWGVATLTLAGQLESGDLHLVREVGGGVLVAVVDGLGHGEEAAAAARLAVTTLDQFAPEPIASLVQRCHEALRGTRGSRALRRAGRGKGRAGPRGPGGGPRAAGGRGRGGAAGPPPPPRIRADGGVGAGSSAGSGRGRRPAADHAPLGG